MVILQGWVKQLLLSLSLTCNVVSGLTFCKSRTGPEPGDAEAGIACAARSWHGVPASPEYPM